MKKLLLILGLSLALATQANAFGKTPPRHPDPYTIISKGKVVADWVDGIANLLVASGGKMYLCRVGRNEWQYSCREIQPRTDKQ